MDQDQELEKLRETGYVILKWSLRILLILESFYFVSSFLTLSEESSVSLALKALMIVILMGVNSYLLVHTDRL